MELQIEAFFFDANKDYLPYYKKFNINIDKEEPITNILPLIKEQSAEFNYNPTKEYFRVNSKIVGADIKVEEVVDRFGQELKIEPLLEYRANSSLLIDDSNFYKNLEPLKPFCNKEDLEFYESLYPIFFGSETFYFNKNYIGDSVIILAEHLINKDNSKEEEILEIITQEDGLWDGEYENNMFKDIDYSQTFESLKKRASNPPKNRVSSLFARSYKEVPLLDEYGVGVYGSYQFENRVRELGFNTISYEAREKKCGISLLDTNEKMALLKAGRVLSSAFDNGADILVVEDSKVLKYFKDNIGKIEKVLNRELPLNLYSLSDLQKLKEAA
ncbi:MAG: hypothetical protein GXN91_00165 [Epsilonproteobacteria bacterium]|nr:hypothetical protein [Campylobacterota bacterium]